jgi:predicted short-subunit dehydrogenase-like oxidoreductase (DUF2520 family)
MRELDRIPTPLTSCAIVGAGRLGTALAAALRETGLEIDGPLGRGADPVGAGAVLLCVPDAEIEAAAAAVTPGVAVGHCSGATGLDVLAGHEAFAFHPLMTVPHDGEAVKTASRAPRGRSPQEGMPHDGEAVKTASRAPRGRSPQEGMPHDGEAVKTASRAPRGRSPQAGMPHDGEAVKTASRAPRGRSRQEPHDGEAVKRVFAGAGAAVAGSTPRALAIAHELAARLGMRATTVADEDRAAYHAAASIASNFLTTLEGAAERLAATAGVDRELLAPLVRASVENWVRLGAERALTGPIARGDEVTVERQRAAIGERTPDLVPMYDALVEATRALAGTPR